jgi:hypothetical protein
LTSSQKLYEKPHPIPPQPQELSQRPPQLAHPLPRGIDGVVCRTIPPLMSITDIITRHDLAATCPLRDIAEPVEFALDARLRITISRFANGSPITSDRLTQIITASLAAEGITLAP